MISLRARLASISTVLLFAAASASGADSPSPETNNANPLAPQPGKSITNALSSERQPAPPSNNAPSFADYRVIAERNIFDTRRSPRSQPSERRDTRRASRVDYLTLLGTMEYSKGPFAFFEGSSSDYNRTISPGQKIAGYGIAAIEHHRVMLQSGTNWLELPVGKQLRREDNGSWRVTDAPERQIASYGSGSSSSSSSYSSYSSSRPTFTPSSFNRAPETPPTQPTPIPSVSPDGLQPQVAVDPETGATMVVQPVLDPNLTNAPAASAPPGGANDVLLRLMQKREEQLNR